MNKFGGGSPFPNEELVVFLITSFPTGLPITSWRSRPPTFGDAQETEGHETTRGRRGAAAKL